MTQYASYIAPNDYQNMVNSDRVVLEYLSGGVSGVFLRGVTADGVDVAGYGCTPIAGVHAVQVNPGRSLQIGRNTPASQGAYLHWTDDEEIIPLPVPQSSPFIATIIARVADPQYGTVVGLVGPRFDVLSGSPASSPTPISDAAINAEGVPGGWVRLWDIRINPGDTGAIPVGQIADARTYLPNRAGDPLSCTSTTRPPGVLGRTIYERDTKATGVYDGAQWLMHDTSWQNFTPVLTASGNSILLNNGILKGRYKRRGSTVMVQYYFRVGSTTSYNGNVGVLAMSLPFPEDAAWADETFPVGVMRASGTSASVNGSATFLKTTPGKIFGLYGSSGSGSDVVVSTPLLGNPNSSWALTFEYPIA